MPEGGRSRFDRPHRRWGTLGLLALLALAFSLALRHDGSTCAHRPPRGPTSTDARSWVAAAIEQTPCPSTGRAVYGLRDSAGRPIGVLDPIADPAGGYLGVYHTQLSPAGSRGAQAFAVVLGHSTDLTRWTRVRVLDPLGASMPTLAAIPGTPGYLLAYEKATGTGDFIRMAYFASLDRLLAGHPAAVRSLPRRLSGTVNGTPSFLAIAWNGALRQSVVAIAFHYSTHGSPGRHRVDREAIGVLRGWRTWTARPDTATDDLLDRLGLTGSHGDERQFVVAGQTWGVYEAQEPAASKAGTEAGWHVVLDDVGSHRAFPLRLDTVAGTLATSFGNPVVRVLPAPRGTGQVLVCTLYVFPTGSAHPNAGELLYWQPIR